MHMRSILYNYCCGVILLLILSIGWNQVHFTTGNYADCSDRVYTQSRDVTVVINMGADESKSTGSASGASVAVDFPNSCRHESDAVAWTLLHQTTVNKWKDGHAGQWLSVQVRASWWTRRSVVVCVGARILITFTGLPVHVTFWMVATKRCIFLLLLLLTALKHVKICTSYW